MIPTRTIYAKRGRVIFSVLGGALFLFCGTMGYGYFNALRPDYSQVIASGLLSFGGLVILVTGWTLRIEVDENGIRAGSCWRIRSMLWSDLDYSATYVLSERDHPFGIRLYRNGDNASWISVRLKNYSKTDVQWMLSELPLKLRETRNANLDGEQMPEPKTRKRHQ